MRHVRRETRLEAYADLVQLWVRVHLAKALLALGLPSLALLAAGEPGPDRARLDDLEGR